MFGQQAHAVWHDHKLLGRQVVVRGARALQPMHKVARQLWRDAPVEQVFVQVVKVNAAGGRIVLQDLPVAQGSALSRRGVANDVLGIAQRFQVVLQRPHLRGTTGAVSVMLR